MQKKNAHFRGTSGTTPISPGQQPAHT